MTQVYWHWDLKTLGSGAHPSSLSGKSLTRLFFLLPQLSKCQELIRGYITLELRSVTLNRTNWLHFMSLLSMLWLRTFQMGLIIYVSLLLLTPKILSVPFDPQDNAFMPWAHSYAAFHNCGMLPSSWWKAFVVDISTSRKRLSPSLRIPSTTIICDASSSSDDIYQP